jgi:energy-coupling factor transporter ATP-binding protein EcfA2
MRLAAIYIEDHEYLFKEPQTINFGGKYFYQFENIHLNIIIKRTLNEDFIPDFFNLTDLQSKVTNLTAIVGQNGAGKSTLLDIIRSEFTSNRNALPASKCLFLFEVEGRSKPIISRNDFNKVFLRNGTSWVRRELTNGIKIEPQTIYYSPHFDYKYNPDFSDIDNHDISFDKIVESDLEGLTEKNTNVNGRSYSATQELLFKNSLRQINFLNSDLVIKENVFKDLFELQHHHGPILHFRGYKEIDEDWNKPYELRTILKRIKEKIEIEKRNWPKYRDEGASQAQIHQYLLKRNILDCILSLLNRQMERNNSFLQEGYFPFEKLEKEFEAASAYDTFMLFVKHSRIKLSSSKAKNILSESVLKLFLEKIYSTIEKADSEAKITNGTLKTSVEDAVEILNLQRQFLNELNSYYIKFYHNREDLTSESNWRIEEFINYMPFSRRMSSGESSLLNFYSRIYDFLATNLKEIKYRRLSKHYILLLDEADLTFHIKWKKKYVKALLKTLPYFFDELENKPSIEIIFTTHDPITLSDIPNTNVIYIEREDYNSPSKILDFNNTKRPQKTFGANISDLIADSFFIEDSLIGNFAFDKIQETINWLNDMNNLENEDYYQKLIRTIDEPIIQRKLAEMFDEKMNGNFQIEVINYQIEKLNELKKRIQE